MIKLVVHRGVLRKLFIISTGLFIFSIAGILHSINHQSSNSTGSFFGLLFVSSLVLAVASRIGLNFAKAKKSSTEPSVWLAQIILILALIFVGTLLYGIYQWAND